MVTAIILLNVARDEINNVSQKLVDMESVTEVFSVSGRYDLVAVIRTKDNDGIAEFVTDQMNGIRGIITTETLLAFKTFSRYDLEHMFSIGE